MRTKLAYYALPFLLAAGFTSCSTRIVNKPLESIDEADGIPWIETADYDVYVVENNPKTKKRILYFGRHSLGDKINQTTIDPDRPKWATNYYSQPFASGSLGVDLNDAGDLKKASVTSQNGAARAADTASIVVETAGELKKDE